MRFPLHQFGHLSAGAGLALLLAVGPWISAASAARLLVIGPAGAQVQLNGDQMAPLPWAAPLELGTGNHEIFLRLGGYEAHREAFLLREDSEELTLEVDLLRLDRWRSTGYSLLLAGGGQLYQGRRKSGYAWMLTQISALAFALASDTSMKNSGEELEDAQRDYNEAVSPAAITAARAELAARGEDVDAWASRRNIAVGVALGAALLSGLEAWWAHPGQSPELGPQLDFARGESRIGWGWSF